IRLFELQNSDEQMRLLCYFTACVAFYRKQDLDSAEKYALKAINFYSDYLDAHCILSSIYFLRKEYDKCKKATENYLRTLKSLQSDPSKAMLIPFNTINHAWLAHTRMAINHYEQGNQNCGHQALNNAINCAEGAWEPYFVIGKHFANQNNLKMAVRFLHDGLKHDPGNREIQYYLASTYERSGEAEKAITCFKQILGYHSEEVLAQHNLGLLLLRCNKPGEAIKSFKSVINKEPEHFDALLNMAIAYEKIGKISQSKDIYNTLTMIKPDNPEVQLRLGSIYLLENDNIRAKEYFLKLLNSEKNLTEAHLSLSKVYLSMNDPENCIRSCDELLKHLKLPRNITINSLRDLSNLYVLIGTTLLKQHKVALSEFSFEIAVLLDPDALKAIQPEAISPVTSNS
ncbi:MAG: tetratricopeptide repeat protein, partial [Candidatus Scalindua sp.]|nr:tetratricopeptide repeat protein [Candidatus Scalindua sp.]